MSPEHFAELVGYKPKFITEKLDESDSFRNICWRKAGNREATAEFGLEFDPERNGTYFYFEILDLNGYADGDFIPLDSGRRLVQILEWVKSDERYAELAAAVKGHVLNSINRINFMKV